VTSLNVFMSFLCRYLLPSNFFCSPFFGLFTSVVFLDALQAKELSRVEWA